MDKEKSRSYQEGKEKIRKKLAGRPYRIGVDLGVGSTGIAVVAMMKMNGKFVPAELVFATSRIFESSAGAADRRQKRGQRNSIRHKANRMQKLWKLLASRGLMLPFTSDVSTDTACLRFVEELKRKDVYELRLKGLTSKLSLAELGYALYHIAGHRGASSILSFVEENDQDEKEIENRRETERICKEHGLDTFIEVLDWSRREHGTNCRNRQGASELTPLPTRDIIINELDRLLANQQIFHPEILTSEYVETIKDCILYENEKIAPEAGKCSYFPNEKRLPKAAFINEERRLWEAVNNVRLVIEEFVGGRIKSKRVALNQDEKRILYSVLREGMTVTERTFRKVFPEHVTCKDVLLQGVMKKSQKIEGFRLRALEEIPWFAHLDDLDRIHFLEDYMSSPDERKIRLLLKTKYGLGDDDVSRLSTLIPNSVVGYTSVGLSAMKIILAHIKGEGLSWQEAEAKALDSGELENQVADMVYDILPYYGMVIPESAQALVGKAWHSAFTEKCNTKGFHFPATNRDEELYGRISNPVVHQALNELRKMINELIEITGYKPQSICIELARDFKVGRMKREEISRENDRREKENKRIETYCRKKGIPSRDIKIVRLLEEQHFICPYCLKQISDQDVIANRVDYDHIFPEEDTGDSSSDNLVVSHKTCNESRKGKRIPFAAFGTDPEFWIKIEKYLDDCNFPPSKRKRFETTQEEYEEFLATHSFIPRFAPDNAYIARVARRYLQCLYMKEDRAIAVTTIRGSETAFLRRAWHLNGITNALSSALGMDNPDVFSNRKSRDDHRHHALDAIVAALFTPSYSYLIESLISRGYKPGEVSRRMPLPFVGRYGEDLSRKEHVTQFRNEIENFITSQTYVSRKQSTSRNGELIKDSFYSIVAHGRDAVVLCMKKPVKDISVDKIEGTGSNTLYGVMLDSRFKLPSYISQEDAARVDRMIAHNKETLNKIIAAIEPAREKLQKQNENREKSGKKALKISDRLLISTACQLVGGKYYKLSNNDNRKVFYYAKNASMAETGGNYSLDLFWNADGKLCGEVIRKVDLNRKDFVPKYKADGYALFERIYPKDVLEIDLIPSKTPNDKKALSQSFITPNATCGRTFIIVDTFTEVGTGIQVWFKPLVASGCSSVQSSFRINGLPKMNARKVVLSSLGIVVYRSRNLSGRNDVESD